MSHIDMLFVAYLFTFATVIYSVWTIRWEKTAHNMSIILFETCHTLNTIFTIGSHRKKCKKFSYLELFVILELFTNKFACFSSAKKIQQRTIKIDYLIPEIVDVSKKRQKVNSKMNENDEKIKRATKRKLKK